MVGILSASTTCMSTIWAMEPLLAKGKDDVATIFTPSAIVARLHHALIRQQITIEQQAPSNDPNVAHYRSLLAPYPKDKGSLERIAAEKAKNCGGRRNEENSRIKQEIIHNHQCCTAQCQQ